jgi:hypothetical protein
VGSFDAIVRSTLYVPEYLIIVCFMSRFGFNIWWSMDLTINNMLKVSSIRFMPLPKDTVPNGVYFTRFATCCNWMLQ